MTDNIKPKKKYNVIMTGEQVEALEDLLIMVRYSSLYTDTRKTPRYLDTIGKVHYEKR